MPENSTISNPYRPYIILFPLPMLVFFTNMHSALSSHTICTLSFIMYQKIPILLILFIKPRTLPMLVFFTNMQSALSSHTIAARVGVL